MIDLEILMKEADELDPMPASSTRLAALLADEDWVLEDIVDVIELDPALTGRLLNRANSVLGGARVEIHSVHQAVTRVGPGVVLSLGVASVIRNTMQLPIEAYGLSEGQLWRHSVASALAAEEARKHCRIQLPPQSFAAALLHDIGKLVLGRHLENEVQGMLDGVHEWGSQRSLLELESQKMGIHHARFGALIARNWKLPKGIAAGIAYHHEPASAPDGEVRVLASLIAVADLVAHQIGEAGSTNRPTIPRECLEVLGLSREGFRKLCDATDRELERALELYD